MKIFSIEGNIGSGKSTIIERLKNHNLGKIYFLPEPVDIWNTITDSSGVTILEKYYLDKHRYSFSFQMMTYITRLSQLRKAMKELPNDTIIITERCLYTDLNVFAKMLYDSCLIEEIEFSIYLKWFHEFIDFQLTGLIYIKTTPGVCLERINVRNRKGEENIPISYLIDCHDYHEKWITFSDVNKIILNGNGEIDLNKLIDFFNYF